MQGKLGNLLGLLSITSVIGYSFMFSFTRDQYTSLLITYTLLFAAYLGFIYVSKKASLQGVTMLPTITGRWFYGQPLLGGLFLLGLVIRLSLLEYTPNLSQDFYRFIWDGHTLLHGNNPYLLLPDDVIASGHFNHIPNASFLHAQMGSISGRNYSNYPPLNQLFFALAAFLGGKSMLATAVWMRMFIIAFEVGIFIVGIKLLRLLGKPLWLIALYYLNPFVIIELTGNLHWEGAMAFLCLLAIYLFFKYKHHWSAFFLGYGVLLKLIPLLFLPALYRRLGFKKAVIYYTLVLGVIVLGFLPFVSDDLIANYGRSVGLWFGNFEFNAGLFNVVKWLGYTFTGANVIQTASKILPLIALIIIIALALVRKNEYPERLLETIVLSFTAYLFLTSTVHPWYIIIPLLFSVFTRYRYMFLWSFTIFLSYQAYSNPGNFEHGWILALEYIPVYGLLVYEVYKVSRRRVESVND